MEYHISKIMKIRKGTKDGAFTLKRSLNKASEVIEAKSSSSDLP